MLCLVDMQTRKMKFIDFIFELKNKENGIGKKTPSLPPPPPAAAAIITRHIKKNDNDILKSNEDYLYGSWKISMLPFWERQRKKKQTNKENVKPSNLEFDTVFSSSSIKSNKKYIKNNNKQKRVTSLKYVVVGRPFYAILAWKSTHTQQQLRRANAWGMYAQIQFNERNTSIQMDMNSLA